MGFFKKIRDKLKKTVRKVSRAVYKPIAKVLGPELATVTLAVGGYFGGGFLASKFGASAAAAAGNLGLRVSPGVGKLAAKSVSALAGSLPKIGAAAVPALAFSGSGGVGAPPSTSAPIPIPPPPASAAYDNPVSTPVAPSVPRLDPETNEPNREAAISGPGANVESGQEAGEYARNYFDALAPNTTEFERIGSSAAGAGGNWQDLRKDRAGREFEFKAAQHLQAKELQNKKDVANINAKAQILSNLSPQSGPLAGQALQAMGLGGNAALTGIGNEILSKITGREFSGVNIGDQRQPEQLRILENQANAAISKMGAEEMQSLNQIVISQLSTAAGLAETDFKITGGASQPGKVFQDLKGITAEAGQGAIELGRRLWDMLPGSDKLSEQEKQNIVSELQDEMPTNAKNLQDYVDQIYRNYQNIQDEHKAPKNNHIPVR